MSEMNGLRCAPAESTSLFKLDDKHTGGSLSKQKKCFLKGLERQLREHPSKAPLMAAA